MTAEKLNGLMAGMLVELSDELENLGAALCSDPALVQAHASRLQKIDLIAQTQRALADVLRAECPMNAIDELELDGLKARLCA